MDIFSDKLIKFCQKQEYVDDILSGKLFMNELGTFNNVTDSFRNDIYDGYRVQEGDAIARIKWRGESIRFPITKLPMSFVGANKIPVFSAVQLSKNILDEITPGQYKFKKIVLDHMEQFGQYAVIINKTELMNKVEEYANRNNVRIHCGNIRYMDSKNPLPKVDSWEEQIHEFIFVKTTSDGRDYQHQNEWRMAVTYPQVIPEDKNYFQMIVGELEYSIQIPSFEWLRDGVLNVEHIDVDS